MGRTGVAEQQKWMESGATKLDMDAHHDKVSIIDINYLIIIILGVSERSPLGYGLRKNFII